jgi:hypothetical protein
MPTIAEAMRAAATLIESAEAGTIDPHTFENETTAMLKDPLTARGFMAALATNPLPEDAGVKDAAVKAIRGTRESSYGLIIKNIVMATCAGKQHALGGFEREAALSQATAANSCQLAVLLKDPELAAMASDLLSAISHWPKREDDNPWYDFFERWHYSKNFLLEAVPLLSQIAEQSPEQNT